MRDLVPLPPWRQKLNAFKSRWARGKIRRRSAYRALKTMVHRALTLAVSVVGATLMAYGAYLIFAPAGYIVGGILCWIVLWSHEQDKGGRE